MVPAFHQGRYLAVAQIKYRHKQQVNKAITKSNMSVMRRARHDTSPKTGRRSRPLDAKTKTIVIDARGR